MILGVLCAPAFGQTTAIDWNDKGNVLVDQGKYDEAIKAYDRAIEINPQLAEVWNNKGLALYHQGKYSEAIQAYDDNRDQSAIGRSLVQQRQCSQVAWSYYRGRRCIR